jgi:hypothetical protein
MDETTIATDRELFECPDCGLKTLEWDGVPDATGDGVLRAEIRCGDDLCSFTGAEYWHITETVRTSD